jgi:hypothetical protein
VCLIKFAWMSLAMEENEPFDLLGIRLFGLQAEVSQPGGKTNLVEQFNRLHDD